MLRRRGFNSLTHHKQDSSDSLFSQQESCDTTSGDGTAENQSALLSDQKSGTKKKANSDSEFYLSDSCNDDSNCILEDEKYFDPSDGDPGELGEMDELEPERAIHHAASESALLLNAKTNKLSSGPDDFQRSYKADSSGSSKSHRSTGNRTPDTGKSDFVESDIREPVGEFQTERDQKNGEIDFDVISLSLNNKSKNDNGNINYDSRNIIEKNSKLSNLNSRNALFSQDQSLPSKDSTNAKLIFSSSSSSTSVNEEKSEDSVAVANVLSAESLMDDIASSLNVKLSNAKATAIIEKYKVCAYNGLCYVMLYAMLYVVMFCALLCYAVLCYVVLCYAML